MMQSKPFNPAAYLSTFDVASVSMRKYVDDGAQGKRVSVKTYYNILDAKLSALQGGEMGVIVARPGRMKTTLLLNMARLHCEKAGGMAVIVTSELPRTPLEVQTLSMLSGVNVSVIREGGYDVPTMDALVEGCRKREGAGIILIGHDTKTAERQERLNPDQIAKCFEYLLANHIQPTWLGQDYIQKLPPPRPGNSKAEDVGEVLGAMRLIASWVDVPMWVCVQASREVDKTAPYIPTQDDAQWSSSIEQDADAFLSLMYPCKQWTPGTTFKLNPSDGKSYVCREDMLLVYLAKQRYGPWPSMCWLKVVGPNLIGEYDLQEGPYE